MRLEIPFFNSQIWRSLMSMKDLLQVKQFSVLRYFNFLIKTAVNPQMLDNCNHEDASKI